MARWHKPLACELHVQVKTPSTTTSPNPDGTLRRLGCGLPAICVLSIRASRLVAISRRRNSLRVVLHLPDVFDFPKTELDLSHLCNRRFDNLWARSIPTLEPGATGFVSKDHIRRSITWGDVCLGRFPAVLYWRCDWVWDSASGCAARDIGLWPVKVQARRASFDVAHFDCFIRLRIGILGLKAVSWFLRVFSGHVWILFGFESTDALAL